MHYCVLRRVLMNRGTPSCFFLSTVRISLNAHINIACDVMIGVSTNGGDASH